jgi:hypothetical protein
MTKTVKTLVSDIYEIVDKGFTPKKENMEIFSKNLVEALTKSFEQGCDLSKEPPRLRMSNIGTPDRKLWYIMHSQAQDNLKPSQAISFMYGHMVEQLLLLLAREAGHVVEDEQKEVELEGIKGHLDAKIDGVLLDCKGMSNYGFQKFLTGAVLTNDSFGYIPQISGYAQAEEAKTAGFFVFNKERGTICLFLLDDMDLINAKARIQHVKEMVAKKEPPKRCFAPEEEGKSGNLILKKECGYCPFHKECWKDSNDGRGLRTFKYSTGYKHFVKIVKEPRVEEILDEKEEIPNNFISNTEEEVV